MMNSRKLRMRLLHLFTRAPRSPVAQITIYFAALSLLVTMAILFIPMVGDALVGPTAADSGVSAGAMRDLLADPVGEARNHLLFDIRMAIVMTATMLVTIPLSWGYMAVREDTGYDQSVVQTLVVLPVVVAAIMMIVQSSLALAFALAGVAAAVRFRNTLKDVADATYVFLSIGIGIAAGTGSWTAALVMVAAFTYVSVLLWRCHFGECDVPSNAPSRSGGRQKAKAVRGRITIEARDHAAREAAEQALSRSAKQWKLSKALNLDAGGKRLAYRVRLKRSETAESLSTALAALAPVGVNHPEFAAWSPAADE